MIQLTMLNGMASADFTAALDQHREWGLSLLDLKDGIFSRAILDLTDEEAARAAALIRDRSLSVYCFSSVLFHNAVEQGEGYFRAEVERLHRLLDIAQIMQPQIIRLIAPQIARDIAVGERMAYVLAEHPWLIARYQDAIDLIHEAGFHATIENECGRCLIASPREALELYAAIDRSDALHFTWDVQNMWEAGVFPSIDAYQQMKHVIGYYHVKGGQHDSNSLQLRWSSALEDASWPVLEITRQVILDGVSPVICLNPSHGAPKPGYTYHGVTTRDLAYLRRNLPDIA